jgi:hypothetical protein
MLERKMRIRIARATIDDRIQNFVSSLRYMN